MARRFREGMEDRVIGGAARSCAGWPRAALALPPASNGSASEASGLHVFRAPGDRPASTRKEREQVGVVLGEHGANVARHAGDASERVRPLPGYPRTPPGYANLLAVPVKSSAMWVAIILMSSKYRRSIQVMRVSIFFTSIFFVGDLALHDTHTKSSWRLGVVVSSNLPAVYLRTCRLACRAGSAGGASRPHDRFPPLAGFSAFSCIHQLQASLNKPADHVAAVQE